MASDFISIEVLSPSEKNSRIPVETPSGRPLILRLTAHRELGIGSFPGWDLFAVEDTRSFLLFENPDGCVSLIQNRDDLVAARQLAKENKVQYNAFNRYTSQPERTLSTFLFFRLRQDF